jgi:fumarate reductase subunit C
MKAEPNEIIIENNHKTRRRRYLQKKRRREFKRDIQAERALQRKFFLSIGILIVVLAVFIFKPGEDSWPRWVLVIRNPVMVILSTLIVFLAITSPLIVEVHFYPRPLSGPGRKYYIAGRDPRFNKLL